MALIVRGFVRAFGENRTGWVPKIASFTFSTPAFFGTAFFLVIPLAPVLAFQLGRGAHHFGDPTDEERLKNGHLHFCSVVRSGNAYPLAPLSHQNCLNTLAGPPSNRMVMGYYQTELGDIVGENADGEKILFQPVTAIHY
jgi:hypothetical protein